MMKKFLTGIAFCFCLLALTLCVSAEEALYVLDWAELLTEEEEASLNAVLAEISERNRANIIVAAVESLEGDTAQNFADNLYDAGLTYFGLLDGTEDGALFLLAMNERQWAISTTGYGITVIHEPALDHMEEEIVPYLSAGMYSDAFLTFGTLCDACWNPDPALHDWYYDTRSYESGGTGTFGAEWILIALIAGFLVALIPMGRLKAQLNTVHMQTGAASYRKEDTVRITRSEDLFLYRNITKKPIPREEPTRSGGGGLTHTSSSGRTHGGRSGGF